MDDKLKFIASHEKDPLLAPRRRFTRGDRIRGAKPLDQGRRQLQHLLRTVSALLRRNEIGTMPASWEAGSFSQEMKSPGPDELRGALRAWSETPAPDPHLTLRVERAVAERSPVGQAAWRRGLSRLVAQATWFRLACAGIAGGVLLGIGMAEWRRWREQSELPGRYLQWIDPTVATTRVTRS